MENWKEIRQQVLMHGLSQRAAREKYQPGLAYVEEDSGDAEPPGYRQS